MRRRDVVHDSYFYVKVFECVIQILVHAFDDFLTEQLSRNDNQLHPPPIRMDKLKVIDFLSVFMEQIRGNRLDGGPDGLFGDEEKLRFPANFFNDRE